MFRLASLIYAVAGPTLAGILIVVALSAGRDGLNAILYAAAIGAVLALPASWLVAKKMLATA
ncbi:hypothetical protein [Phaeovulum sp.]|uniref:hypothetical protein n=1 Tax=Phaeovulum sp. TaxID=2934796 RepID=UPI002731DEEE|nr:hypothetical protein [Phaeovulum sp.]MDP1669965.1 hypothetical protein [Phaeovulum sp.]MDZ4118677.1 hypothetical protein [Phaeovulum sp.]